MVGEVGLVRFGMEGSKSTTINQSMTDKGGHRAARAAKNVALLLASKVLLV